MISRQKFAVKEKKNKKQKKNEHLKGSMFSFKCLFN